MLNAQSKLDILLFILLRYERGRGRSLIDDIFLNLLAQTPSESASPSGGTFFVILSLTRFTLETPANFNLRDASESLLFHIFYV